MRKSILSLLFLYLIAFIAGPVEAGPLCGVPADKVATLPPQHGFKDGQPLSDKEDRSRWFVNNDGHVYRCPSWVPTGGDVDTPRPVPPTQCPSSDQAWPADALGWGGANKDWCSAWGKKAGQRFNRLKGTSADKPKPLTNVNPGYKGTIYLQCHPDGKWRIATDRDTSCRKRR